MTDLSVEILKGVLAWTLIIASVAKWREPGPETFLASLPLVRDILWRGLIYIEGIIGFFIVIGDPHHLGVYGATVLFSSFLIYRLGILWRGGDVACACFGRLLRDSQGPVVLWRSGALAFISWFVTGTSLVGLAPTQMDIVDRAISIVLAGLVVTAYFTIELSAGMLKRPAPTPLHSSNANTAKSTGR